MGNINNIWFIKDSGNSWAETKCQLDNCYSIPYLAGDSLYLQVDVPADFDFTEIWLCRPDGTRVQELLAIAHYKLITYEDNVKRVIFQVPEDSYACNGEPCTKCTASLYQPEAGPVPATTIWVDNYVAGTNNVTVTIIDMVNMVNWDVTNIAAPLPSGFERIDLTTFYVPCDIDPTEWNLQFTSTGPFGNHTFTWPEVTEEVEVDGCVPLPCFHFEIPLLQDDVEEAILQSEPFHCPQCEDTVVVKGDYCLSNTDIFGNLLFSFVGEGESQSGDLESPTNDMRIQAVLKPLPSAISFNRNVRCNNFKSKLVEKYSLKGSFGVDFPDYMVRMIEAIFAAKKLYIDGDEYIVNSESIFTERNVSGYSMKRLEVELQKCEKSVVYDCSCTPAVVDCETNPIEYGGGVLVVTLGDNLGGAVIDRTYMYVEIAFGALTGGYPPYTITGWGTNTGSYVANSDYATFNPNSTTYNVFRKSPAHLSQISESFLIYVEDSAGCTLQIGTTVDTPDMSCVEFDGAFTVGNITNNSIEIQTITSTNAWDCFDISLDDLTSGYPITGINSLPYTIGGLSANTQYQITIRVKCDCGASPASGDNAIGPIIVTTLP